MHNLLVFRELSTLDWPKFFEVYRESSAENAAEWYPELSPEDALAKYEEGYRDYMTCVFQSERGILLVLETVGVYRSEFRL